MPTSTFFNLPEEKRRRIVDAVKSEIARAPYEDISINKIVAAAEIPRGSFYQYFTDKEDMYDFIISRYHARMQAYTARLLEGCGGDLFVMHKKFLDTITSGDASLKSAPTLKNIFSYLKSFDSQKAKNLLEKMNCGSLAHFSLFVGGTPALSYDPRTLDLLDLLSLVTINSAAKIFAHMDQRHALLQAYGRKLDLIRFGYENGKEAPC
jgi:AcrR family transcriptional regulator